MKQELASVIEQACTDLFKTNVSVDLTRPDEQFGDFSTNVGLQLAKQLGKNPRQLAQEIADYIKDSSLLIAAVEVAGPGFINISLTDEAVWSSVNQPLTQPYKGQSVVIETNNPNPFKAMHIGHALNAVLGDTLANLIEAGGANTYRVSYHGDVGLHVGKSMYSLLKFIDGDVDKLKAIAPAERNSFMSKMYAEGSRAYKENEQAKAEIEALTKQSFTRDDPTYDAVYRTVFDWSFEQIDANVKRLGSKPVERKFLESDAENRGVKIVKDNVPKVFKESDGALVFEGSKYGAFDNAFVSNRGTGLYAARDLGLIQLKNEYYHPTKSYIVTADEQKDYFKGVIAAAELCMPEQKGVTVNIPTGMVKLSTGKMSSRDGGVVEISWLFDKISEALKSRDSLVNDQMIAAVIRYRFLQVKIGSDIIFDIDEAVSLQGNSGPYLQYAHARARSILRKSKSAPESGGDLEADERSLLRKISEYPEILAKSIEELLPHHICTYLYELSQAFNRFYEHNRVIDDPREALRLSLVSNYADVLKNGLEILGIHAPEQM